MDIKTALLEEHSKDQIMKIVKFVEENDSRLAELMDIFFNGNFLEGQRAAWAVMHYASRNKNSMLPYVAQMLKNLEKPKLHDAVIRTTVRVWSETDLPENFLGEIFELCFNYLNNPKEKVAVRVFSMSVLFNIVKKEPELAEELRLVIEDHLPHGTAGFKSRGKRILKSLAKM
ncbi:MAG: hypothetical protein AAF502_12935 [Bacteroidota bacterium]